MSKMHLPEKKKGSCPLKPRTYRRGYGSPTFWNENRRLNRLGCFAGFDGGGKTMTRTGGLHMKMWCGNKLRKWAGGRLLLFSSKRENATRNVESRYGNRRWYGYLRRPQARSSHETRTHALYVYGRERRLLYGCLEYAAAFRGVPREF